VDADAEPRQSHDDDQLLARILQRKGTLFWKTTVKIAGSNPASV
jgi:hypothetical protein